MNLDSGNLLFFENPLENNPVNWEMAKRLTQSDREGLLQPQNR